jgi:chromosome segregation ATPase
VDINKIEELFEKIKVAGKIITEYKQLLIAERSKVEELKKQIVFLQNDNQALKEENERLQKLSSSAEKMHKDLEDKIISMLDVLPDFEAIKNESSFSPELETTSSETMGKFDSEEKEEVIEENSSSVFESNIAEETEEINEPVVMEENPFAMEDNEVEFEYESENVSVEDSKLPYYDSEGSEESAYFENLFANIFENEQFSQGNERKPARDLPKGVL